MTETSSPPLSPDSDLDALEAILRDPNLEYDLNRLGIFPGDVLDQLEQYADQPERAAELRRAFAKVLEMRTDPKALRMTVDVDQVSGVRKALRGIGFS